MVSIIIPVYNRSSWLPGLLKRMQTMSEWIHEVIVVDDGSTDDITCVLAAFPKVLAVRQSNQGPSAARNYGLSLASGEFIHFLDSDDLPDANFYKQAFACFEYATNIAVVCNFREVNADGVVLNENYFASRQWSRLVQDEYFSISCLEFEAMLLRNSVIPTSGVLFRRKALTMPWNNSIRVGEDRLFMLENLHSKTSRVCVMPNPSWSYHLHASNSYRANARPDRTAYRDNLCLKQIAKSVPFLSVSDLANLAESKARNYFDWAWHCRCQGRPKTADILLRGSWRLVPNRHTLYAWLVNNFKQFLGPLIKNSRIKRGP